ncbi:MAG: hypothetical protein IJI63_07430 [Clostridiales bacterium]|jgi:hypothetical protein|nr:hypothetical protein [Clostridiales bacterium]
MDPANNEYVIKIKDVLYVILKKLWLMIIVGLIAGAGLFIYNYKKVETVKSSDVLDISKKINASESDVKYQLRAQQVTRARVLVEMIDNTNAQIEFSAMYNSEALYMQIDPDNDYVSYAQFTLTVDDNATNGVDAALFSAYERGIRNGDYLSEYADEIGTKTRYIKELFSVSSSPATNTIINFDNVVDTTGSIFIFVHGPTREYVDETMERIISETYRLSADLNKEVAPHTISLVGVQKIVDSDNSIREQQNNRVAYIHTLQDQIVSYNKTLDAIADDLGVSDKAALISYFKTHDPVEVDGIPTEYSETVTNRKAKIVPNLMWLGIGFGAGALLIALCVVIVYIFGKKIITQAQFFGLFLKIKRIGVMKPLGKRSKYSRFIDVKSEDDTKSGVENCNGLIAANYCNLTKDMNKVLITGTGDKKAMSEAVKALGLKGDFKPDIFSNPDVLKYVSDYDGIVLIEQRKYSLKSVVENEIDLLSNAGTKIVGAIII